MEHDTVLRIFVIITAIAFVAQALTMYALYRVARQFYEEVTRIHAEVKQGVEPLVEGIAEMLRSASEPVQAIMRNLTEVSGLLRERARQADTMLADLLEKCRAQIIRADDLISNLAATIESTAGAVETKVMAPVREVSALVAGVRTGLEFLFSRRRTSSVSHSGGDEELFI